MPPAGLASGDRGRAEGQVQRRLMLMRLGDRPRICSPRRPKPRRRVQPRRVQRLQHRLAAASRPCAARRSPARRTAPGRQVRASATAVPTAACGGISSSSNPAAPMRSTWRTGSGGALRISGSSTASSVPLRRSTAAARRWPGGAVARLHRRQRVQRVLQRAAPLEHGGQQRVGCFPRSGRPAMAIPPAAERGCLGRSDRRRRCAA